MPAEVASGDRFGKSGFCSGCKRYRNVKIIEKGLCSYCRRALGLMPDQVKP